MERKPFNIYGKPPEGLTRFEKFVLRVPQMLPFALVMISLPLIDEFAPAYKLYILPLIAIFMVGYYAYLISIYNKCETLLSEEHKVNKI